MLANVPLFVGCQDDRDLPPAKFLHAELESGILKDGQMKGARSASFDDLAVADSTWSN
jgi:hypothetical protein